MKSEAAAYGPLWTALLDDLAAEAPDPASRTLCLNLRPAWERSQVLQLQAQTREMQLFVQTAAWPELPQQADWLRPLLGQPGAQTRDLRLFLTSLETLRGLLQPRARELPTLSKLAQELLPDSTLLAALPAGKPLSPEAHRLLQQRQSKLKTQQELIARLGLIVARARLARRHQGQLAGIGNSLRLRQWRPERLNQLVLDFELASEMQIVILTGAHGAGKTRLLQSLYLACLMHQAGLAQQCASESQLPVFSSLTLIDAEVPLSERLDRLKPLLRSPQAGRLLLIDDFPAHTSPGEAYALGRALLEKLKVKGALTVAGTHQNLLTRMAEPKGPVRALALEREGSRQGGKLELLWNQQRGAGLIARARQAGWPADLLKQAESYQQGLVQPKSEAPKTPARPAPRREAAPPRLPSKPIGPQVTVGSWVYLPALNLYGELMSAPDRRQRVQILTQGMTLEVGAEQVVLSSRRKEKKGDSSGIRIQTWSSGGEVCDLHGLTVDEALPMLDKFLDTAWYQGLASVRIVHGKGTSALRKAVHAELADIPYVRRYRLGHPGEGDSGVTIVELGD